MLRLREGDPATLVPPIPDQALDELKFSGCLPPALARRTLEARVQRSADVALLPARPPHVVKLGRPLKPRAAVGWARPRS